MKKVITLLLSIVLLSSFTACADNTPKPPSTVPPKVYAENSSIKVRQDSPYEGKSTSKIISGAKGEYESFQIVIQSNENAVSAVTASVSDLKMGQNSIQSQNINLYWQKYVNVSIPTSIYPVGCYPDAILPFEKAVEYKENTMEKSKNQSIIVEVYIPKDAVAGTYSSSVIVETDNQIHAVPFSLKVYDFSIPDKTHAKTAYGLWYDQLVNSSSFANADNGLHKELTLSLKENYYNDFIKYRISPTALPDGLYGTATDFAIAAKKYASSEQVASFQIPTSTQTATSTFIPATHTTLNKNKTIEYIKALATASTDEVNLVEKAYFYVANLIDEPTSDKYNLVKEIDTFIKEAKQEVASLDIFEGKLQVQKAVLNIPHLVTGKAVPQLEGYVDTYCSTIEYVSSPSYQYELEKQREQGVGTWWYTAVKPKAPMPSYHIDAAMLEHRILGWQMMDKKIEGNLYWSTTVFYKYNYAAGIYETRDVWNDPYAFPGAAGDGFLVYPGAKYGIDSFIPTVRLQAIRDGYEDYEYLWLLQNAIIECNQAYGTQIDFNQYVERLCKQLYSGLIQNGNIDVFQQIRSILASILETYYNTGVLADIHTNKAENKASFTFYGENGTAIITSDKKELNIANNQATINIPLSNKVITGFTVDGYTLSLLTPLSMIRCVDIENETELKNFTSSKPTGLDKSDITFTFQSNLEQLKAKTLKMDIYPNPQARPDHTIYARLTKLLQSDFTKVDTIEFSVYNDSSKMIIIKPKLRTATKAKTLEDIVLPPNETTHVVIKLKSYADFDLSSISSIDMAFDSFGNDYTPKTVYISNIYVSLKG